jgi:hypothetical protein
VVSVAGRMTNCPGIPGSKGYPRAQDFQS